MLLLIIFLLQFCLFAMHTNNLLSILYSPTAVVDNEFRPKQARDEGTECGANGTFIFDWEAVANTTSIALNKSILRPYMQVVSQLFRDTNVIPVNISISLQLFYKNMTMGSDSAVDALFRLVKTVNVTSESDGWIELDITSSILSMWSPTCKQSPIIQVTWKMEVDCVSHMNIPIQFVNPAEVELNNTLLREQCNDLQPLLLVYFDDGDLKQVIMGREKLIKEEEKIDNRDRNDAESPLSNRRKKRHNNIGCRVVDYMVDFIDIYMPYMVTPARLNIRRCTGSCNEYYIVSARATNHSSILTAAKYYNDHRYFQRSDSIMYNEQHSWPCCAAIGYRSIYVTIRYNGSYKLILYRDGVVTKCGCR